MTFREKLQEEFPNDIKADYIGDVMDVRVIMHMSLLKVVCVINVVETIL